MEHKRQTYTPSFKAKVVLESMREHKTSAELAAAYNIHPGQIRNWKSLASRGMEELFSKRRKESDLGRDKQIQDLCRQVDQLQKELHWLKESLDMNYRDRVALIDKECKEVKVSHQAELVGVSRSSVYYHQPVGNKQTQQFKNRTGL
jgi:putative transposase